MIRAREWRGGHHKGFTKKKKTDQNLDLTVRERNHMLGSGVVDKSLDKEFGKRARIKYNPMKT